MRDSTQFQVCQKIVLFSKDFTKVLLAKRKGEIDYDGVFSFVGGKLEITDGGIEQGLKREKTEEIGSDIKIRICPNYSWNVYFTKKDGNAMVLPHYVATHESGEVKLNEEYSDYKWIKVAELDAFEPKINTIAPAVSAAKNILKITNSEEFVSI